MTFPSLVRTRSPPRSRWWTSSSSGPDPVPDGRRLRPQRSERRPHLLAEQLWLLPRREVAAAVDLVEVEQVVRVGPLGPAARRLVQLIREDGDGERDGDRLGVEEVALVLPVVARRRDP